MMGSTDATTTRLCASRQQLRAALQRRAHPSHDKVTAAAATAQAAVNLDGRQTASSHHRLVRAMCPLWWRRHPLRMAIQWAAAAAVVVLRPVARQHPRTLLVGVAVMGGLLIWRQPWRGLLKPARLTGWLPQLAAKALANKL